MEKTRLLELYYGNKKNEIINKYNSLIEEERENNELVSHMNEVLNKAADEIKKIYMSQFTEEEIKAFEKGEVLNKSNLNLIRTGEIKVRTNLTVNSSFENELIKTLQKCKNEECDALWELFKTVEAHLEIAETEEKVEEILINYGIINKKTKRLNESEDM